MHGGSMHDGPVDDPWRDVVPQAPPPQVIYVPETPLCLSGEDPVSWAWSAPVLIAHLIRHNANRAMPAQPLLQGVCRAPAKETPLRVFAHEYVQLL